MALDTVTLNIVHNALTNIASEMALVMLKTYGGRRSMRANCDCGMAAMGSLP